MVLALTEGHVTHGDSHRTLCPVQASRIKTRVITPPSQSHDGYFGEECPRIFEAGMSLLLASEGIIHMVV
jgi:hypothetical protein